MKKHLFAFTATLSLILTLALFGCGSDKTTSSGPNSPTPEPTPTSTSSDPIPESLTPTTAIPSTALAPASTGSSTPAPDTSTSQPATKQISSNPYPESAKPTTTIPTTDAASASKPAQEQAPAPTPVVPISTDTPEPGSQIRLMDSYYVSSNLQGYLGRIEINGVLLGVRISTTGSYAISQVALQMYRVGVPDQNIIIGVYTHDSANNQPGKRVGPWSKPVNNANLSAFSGQKVTFAGLNAAVTPGTYWIVAYPASGFGDNHFNYSGIVGTNQASYFGDEHLQPREDSWGEKMYAQVNYWLYGG